ncbi:hypothetical protein HJ536_16165 [Donghicola sp. B5-SW-15]|uniref:Uncharacterized protein n=1 Tax=Donghicola mangrovi TaxID=2729614 RepID=A0A850Q9H9_9RHOB|nr:hypothetical protein [Donghicola mangrovi]NVO24892.1 hypothetical protein [Donghicola mangrovi]
MSLPIAMVTSDQPFPDCLEGARDVDECESKLFGMVEVTLVRMECELIEVGSRPRQFCPRHLIYLWYRPWDALA